MGTVLKRWLRRHHLPPPPHTHLIFNDLVTSAFIFICLFQLLTRAVSFIDDLCLTCLTYTKNQSTNPSSVNILLVVHGFLIKELVDYFLSKCSSTRDSNHDTIPNGSISIFEAILQGGSLDDVKCDVICDVSHLTNVKQN